MHPSCNDVKPMYVTLGEAARRTGLSKATISRAVKSGKLSAAEVHPNGSYSIDLAELARVYDLKPGDGFTNPLVKHLETPPEMGGLQVEIAVLRERLSAISREREEGERRYQLAAQQIEDLRQRLDQSEQERRDKDRQLTALLTDQRQPTAPDTPTPPPEQPSASPKGLRAWLHRLTG